MAMWRVVDGCASVHKVFSMSVPQVLELFSSVVGETCHAASTEWASLHPRVTGIFADVMVGGALHELLFLETILETYTAFHLGAYVWLRFCSSRVIYLRNIPWNKSSSRNIPWNNSSVTNGISIFRKTFFLKDRYFLFFFGLIFLRGIYSVM